LTPPAVGFEATMRYWIVPLLFVWLVAGCVTPRTQKASRPKRPTSGFASADAKNVHDFLIRYQKVIAGEDAKAILRLYDDKARMVPYLVENKRVLTKKDLEARLPTIIRMQRQAAMRLVFREPMDIKVSVSGERANVQVRADLFWQDRGAPQHVALDCYFQMERIDFIWKIKESHQDMSAPGQTAPGLTAAPAAPAGAPDKRFSDTPPLIPTGKQQPLF